MCSKRNNTKQTNYGQNEEKTRFQSITNTNIWAYSVVKYDNYYLYHKNMILWTPESLRFLASFPYFEKRNGKMFMRSPCSVCASTSTFELLNQSL
jgi:hypothetical protein